MSLGTIQLYKDSVLVRPRWKGQFEGGDIGPVTSGDKGPLESGELIPFSEIRQISAVVKGSILKTADIQLQTESDVVWEIRGSPGVYLALQDAFQAWKNRA